MRAIIYVRQSLDRTGDATAVERQRLACQQLCDMRGWQVVEVLVDNDQSATSGKRPAFATLLTRISSRACDVVVVYHLDRLVRRLDQLEQVITLCEDTNVKLATVSGDIDLSTDAGRLVGRILASVARGEVERKGKRQRDANRQRAESGQPHAGGHRAFGYTQDGMQLVEAEAEAVRSACSQILGNGSLRGIAAQWNAQGLTTGKPRWGKHAGEPSRWTAPGVREVLLNSRYAGIRTYQGEEFRGDWPAVVSEETYRAVAALLTDPSRRPPAPYGVALLTQVAVCGVCGATVHSGGGGRRSADIDQSKRYRVYRCSENSGRHITRRADPIDELVKQLVVARLARPDAAELVSRRQEIDLRRLIADREAVRRRQDQLATDFADGVLSSSQLRVATDRLNGHLSTLDAAIAEAGQVSALAPLVAADDVEAAWRDLHVDQQRAVIRELMTVTLLPVGRGTRIFRPESVEIVPKG